MNRILRSFRWQLQVWHSLLLLAVLTAFCGTAVFLEHQVMTRRIDQELRRHAGAVIEQLRHDAERNGDHRRGPPPSVRAEHAAEPSRPALLADPAAMAPASSPQLFHLAWAAGVIVDRSANAPEAISSLPALPGGDAEGAQTRDTWRELIIAGPHGMRLLVGRDIREDLAQARRHAGWLIGAGACVLLAGIAGGWWVATRAIRPLVAISATAEKIAAGNLRERIDASRFATEFGQLAQTLNHTFDRLQSTLLRQVQFTADASHELRTPVSVSLLASQSALSRERPAADYRASLETCQRASQRMRHLVEALLLLARLDAHDDRMPRHPVELRAVVTGTIELLQPLAAKHGIALETALSPHQVHGDASQLAQVVTNLVSNAIYHSPHGARVRLELTATADSAVLTVADRGEGIAPEHLPRIFDRFYRADQARQRTEGRTGLGLAISKAIVEAHHGRIDVVSHLGEGSTFTVTLPLLTPGTSAPTPVA